MSHDHCRHHHHALTGRRLGWAVVLTSAFVLVEAVAGGWSHSLALLSDAGHNFADVLALLLSWYAVRVVRRPSTANRTFGYHRVGIIAALVNALSLVVIGGLIVWEAVTRLRNPPPVAGPLMIGVALGGIALNGLIATWLHAGAKHDLNLRGAYLHMLGDAASAAGVVVAGVIVLVTGRAIADPIVSLLIGVMILGGTWGILRESVDVLLECAPAGLDMGAVAQTIRSAPGVLDVHDLHVWTIGPGVLACSCHVLVAEQSIRSGQQVLRDVTSVLDEQFHINHTTVQVEVDDCPVHDDLRCTMATPPPAPASADFSQPSSEPTSRSVV